MLRCKILKFVKTVAKQYITILLLAALAVAVVEMAVGVQIALRWLLFLSVCYKLLHA